MDSHEADIFADTLKKHYMQKPVEIYNKNKKVCEKVIKQYDVQDVIFNFSQQIKAFQNADKINKGSTSRNNLDAYKTDNFLPINMVSKAQETKQSEQMQSNKFETQCVLDTQLINIIENAEALIDIPKNMSQEFDTTFNNLDTDDKYTAEIQENVDIDSKDLNTQETINKLASITKSDNDSQDDISIELNDKSEEIRNSNDIEVERIIQTKRNEADDKEKTSKSPILNIISPHLKSKTPSPLVYELESFEKFETIALSVIKENPNFEAAKRIINSQIMNNELFIQTHAEPVLGDRDKSPSPVLKITKTPKNAKNAKNTSVIEDSILFSSDEENDFKHDFVDLPLTCALETSFYKQHDVLDKTMFVGFQTASNKSIQINSDSYSKAKSILDNVKVPDEYMSLTKLVEVIDNSSKVKTETLDSRNQNNDQFETKESNYSHNNTDLEIESLKELNIPEVLAKSKRVFEEVVEYADDQDLLSDLEHDDFNTCNSKKVKLSENYLDIDKRNTEVNEKLNVKTVNSSLNTTNICYKDEYHKSNIDPHLNDNLNIDENIMKEFENNFINEEDYSTTTLKTDNDDAKSDSIKIDEVRKKISESPFVGFKTANNKVIKISEQGLAKTRNIFEGIDLNDLEESSKRKRDQNTNSYLEQPSTSKGCMGFRTANNKEIKVSEQALAKTKNIFDNIDNEDILPINKNTVDKQSANMHQIDAALNNNNLKRPSNKSRGFINHFPSNRNNNNNLLKTTKVSPKSLDSLNILNENNNLEVPKIIGFQTASNKTVKISKEALAKSKKIFSEIISDDNEKETYEEHENFIADENVMREFETASMKTKETDNNTNLELTKENKFEETNKHQKLILPPLNLGFKTANNKCIKLSEQALAKTRNIFDGIDLNDLEENINTNKNKNYDAHLDQPSTSKGFMGFRTANNKEIKVSEQALAKTKNIFDNIDNANCIAINNADETSKNMNQNKVVNIQNKNNLKKPSTPLNPIENKHGFLGFKTASNKVVSISEDALAKTKNIFKDIDNFFDKENKNNNNLVLEEMCDSNIVRNPILQGFTTASNKSVKITDEALAKTKNIFQDIDGLFDNKNGSSNDDLLNRSNKATNIMHGFRTASNKKVKISDDALAKTKNVFQGIDDLYKENEISNDDLLNEDLNNINKDTNPIIHGFRTASNKAVKISEDALAKSKKIFEDIEFSQQTNNDLVKDLHKPVFEGFKTANNKTVKISEDALAKSKIVFQDLDNDQNKNVNKENVFCGFQTASNKSVGISKDALLKSKKIFEDLELSQSNFGGSKSNFDKGGKMAFGFKTANNNNVEVSEESLKVTKKLFNNVASNKVNNKECHTKPNDVDIELDELMNTEIIKNLEESLHTEDFSKQSPLSKRSGSPILSCPKAKKRKIFKTPQATNKIIVTGNIETKTPTNNYIFDENYKKIKKYTLKDIKEIDSVNTEAKIDPYILNFNFDTLLDFEFSGKRNDIDSDVWTTDRIRKCFTDSVNKKIVPEGWITNHLKLIIWKLLSYEIYFPNCMDNVCTVKNVLNQLKYRYDRELYNVERPALRKILEKDEVASKLMVLCVAGFYVNGECVSSITNQQNIELLLTDGWYSIKACADRMIDKLIWDDKIFVGTKLAIYGAELMNCEQGIAPWEDTSTIRLKISGNSVRRAKWDTKLGFHGNGAILSHLTAVKPEGGKISRLCVFVARVYPMLYVEKFEDGSTVTRSERLEHIQQMKHETDRQNQIEKLYDELEKMAEQESQDSEGMDSDKGLETGSQIYRHMKRNKDNSEFRVNLTDSQTHLFQDHALKKREKLIQNLQIKVQDLVKKRGLDVPRNVVPLLKMRVADVYRGCVSKAMITIWRPNECLLDLITEGAWLDVYNVVPTAVRFSEIQISAGRQSIFQPSKLNKSNKLKTYTDTLKRKCYPIKDLQTLTIDNYEIDTIGLIFLIDPPTNQFQNIYLTDENKNIVSVNFWGGIKKFGFENILDTGQIVACLNLQRRTGNTKKQIPQYRATEFTHFTRTCKIDFIRKMTEELSTKFLSIDKKKFINDCVAIKNNFNNLRYGNTENVTPYRLNNSDYNISKNKMFIDSPLVGKLDINLNLSGLDFESTFRQTDTQDESPERLLRKRKVNERIAKLQMYGEPPPLNPIHIINKSTIQPYKSPLIQKSDTNIASVKIAENVKSPVLNRTYVKSINPVKLKFSDEDGNTTDPFAEEFDCSPPLSLD